MAYTPRSLCSWLLPVVWALFALLLTGCQQLKTGSLLGKTGEPEKLRVGIVADAPPLAYTKDHVLHGLEAQFAAGLATFAGKHPELVELPRAGLGKALLEGKIDIVMAGMTVIEAHQQKLTTCSPYLVSGQVALVHLDDYQRLGQGTANLTAPDVRIGVVAASSGEALVKGIKPKGRTVRFKDAAQGVRALIGETIDVFIHDLPANFYYAALHIDKGLTPGVTPMTQEPLAWAVRPGDSGMRNLANAYLAELRKSNTLEPLLEQHIPFYHHPAYGLKKP